MATRRRRAAFNAEIALVQEVVSGVCAFILPRLILTHLGSDYNGLTSSIAQFLGFISLLQGGAIGVTRAALYKPLAQRDTAKISSIVKATQIFMRRIALIFAGVTVVYAAVYPVFVEANFSWSFTFSLVLIVSAGLFAQYFFGITYQVVLQADQRRYVNGLVNMAATILNTAIAGFLIVRGGSIHAVKLAGAAIFVLQPILTNLYVSKNYHIDKDAVPDNSAISQRWDAFMHQVAAFIHENSDIMILTIFVNVYEVSVYAVYAMILNSARRLISALRAGMEAAFGDMIVKNERSSLLGGMEQFEFLIFSVANVFYTSTLVLIVPFVMLYTGGITDVSYFRPEFAAVAVCAEIFFCFRMPYQCVVEAAGHYRQTRNGAIAEAAVNVVLSVALVRPFGMVGVAAGTLCAMVFRTVQYGVYASRVILRRDVKVFVKRLLVSALGVGLSLAAIHFVPLYKINSFASWVACAIAVVGIAASVNIVLSLLFYRSAFLAFLRNLPGLIRKKR